MRRARAFLLGLAVLCGSAAGAWTPIELRATVVEVPPVFLAPGIELRSAWSLEATDPAFGGLSGMVIEGDRVIVISDRATMFAARLTGSARQPLAELARRPLRDASGEPLTGWAGDAEALAWEGDGLAVAFERDHRVLSGGWPEPGLIGAPRRLPGAETLAPNDGIEALATLRDGRLLAMAEGRVEDRIMVWVSDGQGGWTRADMPARGRHVVTGADFGPDGTLHVVKRHYTRATGVSIRLVAYPPGPEGLPDPAAAEDLAAWEDASGIDNMEAVAVRPGKDGATDIWLLSDDNFNAGQRTLLLHLRRAR